MSNTRAIACPIMNNVNLPDELPESFLEQYRETGFASRELRYGENNERGAR